MGVGETQDPKPRSFHYLLLKNKYTRSPYFPVPPASVPGLKPSGARTEHKGEGAARDAGKALDQVRGEEGGEESFHLALAVCKVPTASLH